MRKRSFCICENKGADQLRGNSARLICAFVFATRIVRSLYFLNPKFQAPSHLLWLYSPVCVGLVGNPEDWFLSHLLIARCDIGVQVSVRPSTIYVKVLTL